MLDWVLSFVGPALNIFLFIRLNSIYGPSEPHKSDIMHDDVTKWKHFPRYWPFVRGIHRSPMNSPHKGQWRGALMFSLICVWINGWVNSLEAGDLRRHRAHYGVIVMPLWLQSLSHHWYLSIHEYATTCDIFVSISSKNHYCRFLIATPYLQYSVMISAFMCNCFPDQNEVSQERMQHHHQQ